MRFICSLVLLVSVLLGCNSDFFGVNSLGKKGGVQFDPPSDEVIMSQIEADINGLKFDEALQKHNLLKPDTKISRRARGLLAQIFSGQCGLNYVSLSEYLDAAGTGTMMFRLLGAFSTATEAQIAKCQASQAILTEIAPIASDRTVQENITMAFTSMVKIGSVASMLMDTDKDGVIDAGVDICSTAGLTEDNAKELGFDLALINQSLGASAVHSPIGNKQFEDVSNACNSVFALNPEFDFCAVNSKADFTPNMEKGIRSMLKEGLNFGFGANCLGDLSVCNCP